MSTPIKDLTPEKVSQELREIGGLADPNKRPPTMTPNEVLQLLRSNISQLADQVEQAVSWSKREEKLMTLAEAANYYKTTAENLKNLAVAGWNAAVPLGDKWRFRKI